MTYTVISCPVCMEKKFNDASIMVCKRFSGEIWYLFLLICKRLEREREREIGKTLSLMV